MLKNLEDGKLVFRRLYTSINVVKGSIADKDLPTGVIYRGATKLEAKHLNDINNDNKHRMKEGENEDEVDVNVEIPPRIT
ncbi:hypothetical protein F5Y19DRAFT_409594 [Xylariaceae sp. FL1651]|nr:hypothetical protein F5Y19DRAFT_409594 [Xylariaceae sp. FL1651]